MSSAAAAATIFVVVVAFIRVRKKEAPTADGPASADADERVGTAVATLMDARAPCAVRSVIKAVPETVTPCRLKNLRNRSMAAASSRLATLSEQPTWAPAARWLLFWK